MPRLQRCSVVLLVFAWLLVASDAHANRSHHERVDIKPLVEGGKTVGIKLNLTLRPKYGHDMVRIGLSPTGGSTDSAYRRQAADKSEGHLLHQWPEVSGLKDNTPKKITLELRYSDAKKLKPGQSVEIVSAWGNSSWGDSGSTFHIWGMTTPISGTVKSYKLPEGQAVAEKPRARSSRRAKPRKPTAISKSDMARFKKKAEANWAKKKKNGTAKGKKADFIKRSIAAQARAANKSGGSSSAKPTLTRAQEAQFKKKAEANWAKKKKNGTAKGKKADFIKRSIAAQKRAFLKKKGNGNASRLQVRASRSRARASRAKPRARARARAR